MKSKEGQAVMKRLLKKITGVLLGAAIMIPQFAVSAAGNEPTISWQGNYSDSANPKLVVEVTSPIQYQHTITAVIFPKDKKITDYSDYIRVSEVNVKGGEKAKIEFNITDDGFVSADNKYNLSIQCSGYLSSEAKKTESVYLLTPSKTSTLLQRFNNADANGIISVINDAKDTLQLKTEPDGKRAERRAALLISERTAKTGNVFASLDEVRKAWAATDIIAAFSDSGMTASALQDKIAENAEDAELTLNDDYTANKATVCAMLLAYAPSYTGGVTTSDKLADIFGECNGTVVVNKSTTDNIVSNFESYMLYFDIKADTLTKYGSMLDTSKKVAVGTLYNKNFATPSYLVSAFESALNNSGSQSGNGTGTSKDDGKGNGNSSSITGPTASAPSTPSVKSYSDVPQTHWAYGYITDLSSKGVISGYDDNTFLPENTVTREEFTKMIVVAAGLYKSNAECTFSDVAPSAWYYRYIASTYENEIISGVSDDTFGVGTNITRQDVAVIAARVIKRLGVNFTAGATTLTDIDTVSDYARESVELLDGAGIINGFDDNSFKPHNALTRAEAAAIIGKLIGVI